MFPSGRRCLGRTDTRLDFAGRAARRVGEGEHSHTRLGGEAGGGKGSEEGAARKRDTRPCRANLLPCSE